ncbi:MAG: aspartate-semialdehyde dehydrogenase [Acidobacteria bacterium]|nr:aspartate-semialdehyde dehydrogenase [Acidobacteriota bacterium]
MHVAILGATGVVGQEILSVLEQRDFPVTTLRPLASPRSAGRTVTFRGRAIAVEAAGPDSFAGMDVVLASAGATVTRELAPAIRKSGAVLIDNSSAFRMDADVPLVVPEVNPEALPAHRGVIANPNCVAIILTVAVAPIHRAVGIRRLVVSTYQSASGAGLAAMQELRSQARDVLEGREPVPRALPHPIAFNVFSHNAAIGPEGYNGEETKVMRETRKILSDPDLAITATCVRVPVLRAHTESINLTLARPLSPERARALLAQAPGVEIVDDWERNLFPMPAIASGRDAVYVGRIRRDLSQPDGMGLDLFVCGDQLRKGAALNAVQIAEAVVASRAAKVPAAPAEVAHG